MNNIQLSGRIARDPELRTLPDGSSVCTLRLAVAGMGRGGRNETGYINVVSFGSSGEAAAKVLSKGWLVAVSGRLQHETWQQDGNNCHDYTVVGHVEFLARRKARGESESSADAGDAEVSDADFAAAGADDGDVPF